ncbi:MAG: hypothetical protein HRU17_12890 [Polyangiaceae bacterium]|nr:hypothetical protein [Polyangiaceae bacterium]
MSGLGRLSEPLFLFVAHWAEVAKQSYYVFDWSNVYRYDITNDTIINAPAADTASIPHNGGSAHAMAATPF